MEVHGHVENGVIVLEGGVVLPEGTSVVIACEPAKESSQRGHRVQFPLVRSNSPGTFDLTSERVAELLSEDDAAP